MCLISESDWVFFCFFSQGMKLKNWRSSLWLLCFPSRGKANKHSTNLQPLICSFPVSLHGILCQVFNGCGISSQSGCWRSFTSMTFRRFDRCHQLSSWTRCLEPETQLKTMNYKHALTQAFQKSHAYSIFLLTKHAATRFTSAWERFLFSALMPFSKFFLLYISCRTSRKCVLLKEYSSPGVWEEICYQTEIFGDCFCFVLLRKAGERLLWHTVCGNVRALTGQ